ncbi:MAG TPA: DUF1684 domain-containing protein [Candidatus Limnocylindrales bacterium]
MDAGTIPEELALADWRRRVGELYAEVRDLAATEPDTAWQHWRRVREELFRGHSQSPVPEAGRRSFRALHFDYDPALRFEAIALGPEPPPPPGGLGLLALPNSGDEVLSFRRIGTLEVPFKAGPRRLSLFWMSGYAGGLFLPFRDATNGTETYGAGRYLLDAAKSADLGGDPAAGTLVLDFNFAYQPSCAFDPRWACPLAPPQNRLDIPIRAGERIA